MIIVILLVLSLLVGGFLYYRHGAIGFLPTGVLILLLAASYLAGWLTLH
jgi:hypothetical protein